MQRKYQIAVARGMTFLDRRYPEWIDRIDLGRLDVGAHLECPLAQSYQGDFDVLFEQLELSEEQCENLGFMTAHNTPMEEGLAEYDRLTAAWGTAILKGRRENARKKMEQIAQAIIGHKPVEKPSRRRTCAMPVTRP